MTNFHSLGIQENGLDTLLLLSEWKYEPEQGHNASSNGTDLVQDIVLYCAISSTFIFHIGSFYTFFQRIK